MVMTLRDRSTLKRPAPSLDAADAEELRKALRRRYGLDIDLNADDDGDEEFVQTNNEEDATDNSDDDQDVAPSSSADDSTPQSSSRTPITSNSTAAPPTQPTPTGGAGTESEAESRIVQTAANTSAFIPLTVANNSSNQGPERVSTPLSGKEETPMPAQLSNNGILVDSEQTSSTVGPARP